MPKGEEASGGSASAPKQTSSSSESSASHLSPSHQSGNVSSSDAVLSEILKELRELKMGYQQLDSKIEAVSLEMQSPLPKFTSDHRPHRQSLGSLRSDDSQDVVVRNVKSSFRLDKPKFEYPTGSEMDGAFDESVLKFLEECDHHIEMWCSLPENKHKEFEGSEVFAIVSLPLPVQKRVSHNLEMIFEKSEIQGWSLEEIKQAKKWSETTTAEVKKMILTRRAMGVARKEALKSIQPPSLAWAHGAGFIHLDAFEEYKSKMTTQVSRLNAGGVSLSLISIKDAIISAIPDREFRTELYAQFGNSGSLPGPNASGHLVEFSMKTIFDFIRAHIECIRRKGLADSVNKNSVSFSFRSSSTPPTSRKFGSQGPPSRFPARAVHAIENGSEFEFAESDREYWASPYHKGRMATEDDDYTLVNQAVQDAKSKDCRHTGIGPDGKLLCPFLGNPESAKCGFRHPSKDLELKGKGVSKSVPARPLRVHSTEGLGIPYADDSDPPETDL